MKLIDLQGRRVLITQFRRAAAGWREAGPQAAHRCHGIPDDPRGSPSIRVSGCIGDSMNPCLT
jgi:hypothetical protein